MSQPIKVLFADSSSVSRQILTEIFKSHPGTEVSFAAKDGIEAVTEFGRLRPDVVVLDVDLPGMDGVEAAKTIRALDPEVPIIMFSVLTTRYAASTLTSLSSGANDYATKPSLVGHLPKVQQEISDRLIPKVLHWGRQEKSGSNLEAEVSTLAQPEVKETTTASSVDANCRPEFIVIGVSTGGPDSLVTFFKSLPEHFNTPVAVVQHMPAVFTRLLAERIDDVTHLDVREAKHGELFLPGTALLAPGGYHMQVQNIGGKHRVVLDQNEVVNYCRPSVDKMLFSAQKSFGSKCMAIILTGMGRDGLEGCRALSKAGSTILAQDKKSSVIWGMPGAVTEEGLVAYSGSPEDLAIKAGYIAFGAASAASS